MSKYVIANKNSVIVPLDVNTKSSIYPVLSYKTFRRAATRDAARAIKQGFTRPQNYSIIDTVNNVIVR